MYSLQKGDILPLQKFDEECVKPNPTLETTTWFSGGWPSTPLRPILQGLKRWRRIKNMVQRCGDPLYLQQPDKNLAGKGNTNFIFALSLSPRACRGFIFEGGQKEPPWSATSARGGPIPREKGCHNVPFPWARFFFNFSLCKCVSRPHFSAFVSNHIKPYKDAENMLISKIH